MANADAWGNLQQSGTQAFQVPADANNRIVGKTYDAAGNMTDFYNGTSMKYYAYDAENRIKSAGGYACTGACPERSRRNANGMRVRKQTGSNWTEYVYFVGNVIAEKDQSGGWTDYIYGNGKRIAMAAATASPGVTEFYHSDHLGSARLMTNVQGMVVPGSEGTFLPYGQEFNATSTSNHYKFTGKERDAESGLDHAGARYYGSQMGRFTSADPIAMTVKRLSDPQQINLYAYVRNNPLMYVDPTGETIEFANDSSRKRFEEYVKSLDQKSREYATVMQLQGSEVNYVVNVGGRADYAPGAEGNTTTDGNNILVNIKNEGNEKFSMNGRLAHELEHGRQFDDGEISFLKNSKGKWTASPTTYDIGDEINAFKAQLRASPSDAFRSFLPSFANARTDDERKGVLVRISDGYREAAKRGMGNNLNVPGKNPGDLIKSSDAIGRQH